MPGERIAVFANSYRSTKGLFERGQADSAFFLSILASIRNSVLKAARIEGIIFAQPLLDLIDGDFREHAKKRAGQFIGQREAEVVQVEAVTDAIQLAYTREERVSYDVLEETFSASSSAASSEASSDSPRFS